MSLHKRSLTSKYLIENRVTRQFADNLSIDLEVQMRDFAALKNKTK